MVGSSDGDGVVATEGLGDLDGLRVGFRVGRFDTSMLFLVLEPLSA